MQTAILVSYAAPRTSSHGNQKTFRASNVTDDEVCEIVQTCESEENDTTISKV
jgi:hypothetical protein